MHKICSVLFIWMISLSSYAQLWKETVIQNVADIEKEVYIPEKHKVFILDDVAMKNMLWSVPEEYTETNDSVKVIIFPLADGTFDSFRVVEYSMMEDQLAARYPDIKTFYGYSETNPFRSIRIDYTYLGLRAVISEKYEKTYIEYLSRKDRNTRMIYSRKDYTKKKFWKCDFDESLHGNSGGKSQRNRGLRAGDCQLRTYRLAQATTGEYSNFHGATNVAQSGLVMSAVTTTINRINEIYEQDITVRLILIDNTDQLFFYNTVTDPYTNNNGGTMLGQNQTTCDNIIGSANYDIGHVFSTGGGGVAYLNAVCNNSTKAGGVTGLSSPVGDPFDIDYVAHEFGHQFGARHTQNNNCNRSSATAMEPGSASTIMGYAGICGPNVQNNSDPYFHAISIQEMSSRITSTSCHSTIGFANNAPVLADLQDFHIPVSTPFVLTAEGSDNDGDPLLYCWEQMNNQTAAMPPQSTNTVGPMFRSRIPVSSPSRYFPPLSNIVSNTANTWEVLPSVGRTLNFRVTVRDVPGINGDAGCTDEKNMILTTVAGAGPFTITSHNTPAVWEEGEVVTITWNVANTDVSPIQCERVEVWLSYDGGSDFNTLVASYLSNDGFADITVPPGISTEARFMVKAMNNVFFDINNADITINPGQSTFFMSANPSSVTVCESDTVFFTISTSSFGGYTEVVSFTVPNLPAGAMATFDPPVVPAGSETTLAVSHLNGLVGTHHLSIAGNSGPVVRNYIVELNVGPQPPLVFLSQPVNNAQGVSLKPVLSWQNNNSIPYEYQLSGDQDFSRILVSGMTNDTFFIPSDYLWGDVRYFWRVRSLSDLCEADWSDVRSFTTEKCGLVFAEDIPQGISSSGTPTINSFIDVYDRGDLIDIDVLELRGRHSWVGDLRFDLYRPGSNNFVRIWDQPCNSARNADFDVQFDDQVPAGLWPCPPTDGKSYRPSNRLSAFNNVDLRGQWRLEIQDLFDQDGGFLDEWGLKLCASDYCRLHVDQTHFEGVGSLSAALDCAFPGDTILLTEVLNNDTIHLDTQHFVVNKNVTIITQPGTMVYILSHSDQPVFFIDSQGELTLEGITILGSQSSEASLVNTGNLTLKNISIHRSTGGPDAVALKNDSPLQLTIQGETHILH